MSARIASSSRPVLDLARRIGGCIPYVRDGHVAVPQVAAVRWLGSRRLHGDGDTGLEDSFGRRAPRRCAGPDAPEARVSVQVWQMPMRQPKGILCRPSRRPRAALSRRRLPPSGRRRRRSPCRLRRRLSPSSSVNRSTWSCCRGGPPRSARHRVEHRAGPQAQAPRSLQSGQRSRALGEGEHALPGSVNRSMIPQRRCACSCSSAQLVAEDHPVLGRRGSETAGSAHFHPSFRNRFERRLDPYALRLGRRPRPINATGSSGARPAAIKLPAITSRCSTPIRIRRVSIARFKPLPVNGRHAFPMACDDGERCGDSAISVSECLPKMEPPQRRRY